MRLFSYLACVVFVSLLAACASPREKLIESGATPYTEAEVKELVTGKTEIWTKGAGYYGPDGTLNVRWKGEDHIRAWLGVEGFRPWDAGLHHSVHERQDRLR